MTNRHKYIFLILDVFIIALYLLFLIIHVHLFKRDNGFSPFAIIVHLLPLVLSIVFCALLFFLKYKSLFAILSAFSIAIGPSVHVIANLSVGVNIFRIEWVLIDVTWFSSLAVSGYAIFLICKFKGK